MRPKSKQREIDYILMLWSLNSNYLTMIVSKVLVSDHTVHTHAKGVLANTDSFAMGLTRFFSLANGIYPVITGSEQALTHH